MGETQSPRNGHMLISAKRFMLRSWVTVQARRPNDTPKTLQRNFLDVQAGCGNGHRQIR